MSSSSHAACNPTKQGVNSHQGVAPNFAPKPICEACEHVYKIGMPGCLCAPNPNVKPVPSGWTDNPGQTTLGTLMALGGLTGQNGQAFDSKFIS